MTTLIITRGLPASGKSTYARAWVDADPQHRAEINRDYLRLMMHGGFADAERQVMAVRDEAIAALLSRGIDVVCSDTNLPQRTARDLLKLARRAGADFMVEDFTDVPADVCVQRDSVRADKNPVGEQVIREMHARFLAGRNLPLPWPAEPEMTAGDPVPFVAAEGTPDAILVDIDGTVALHGTRNPFDETRVHEDRPNEPVIRLVRLLASTHWVVFASGRTNGCKAATEAWLREHVGVQFDLFMRPAGDGRKDAVVKRELFDGCVRPFYNVRLVIDDRDQVVRMWRSLGLTCLQVADGNF